MIFCNRLLAMLSLTALLAVIVSSCNSTDEDIKVGTTVPVELALNVSTQQSTGTNTRMTADAVQVNGNFRGIQDWHLIPFKVSSLPSPPTKPVTTDNTSTLLPGVITPALARVYETYNFLDDNIIDATIGTNAYLCYARAGRTDTTTPDNPDNFANGSTVASFGDNSPNNITFSPKQICSADDFANNANGTALLDYLNGIAQAEVTVSGTTYKWCESDSYDSGLGRIFKSLVNLDESVTSSPSVYRHFGGSSTNIKALVTKIYNAVAVLSFTSGTWQDQLKNKILEQILDGLDSTGDYTLDDHTHEITITSLGTNTTTNTSRDGFPANLSLPDGVAVVQWDDTQKAFAYTIYPTSSDAKILRYTDLVYPAELWYYANSPIKTSKSSRASYYNSTNTWNTVLGQYADGPSVALETRSIAITDPLQYGVGCIEAVVQATADPLLDAKDTDISLTHDEGSTTMNNFPLTAVLFGGQYKQRFDFTPVIVDGYPKVLYDTKMGYDVNNGTGTVNLRLGNLNSVDDDGAVKFYTLSLQTIDAATSNTDAPVKIVLEFQNNSDESFYGVDGIIAPGMRFYLVGTVAAPTEKGGSSLPENEQRVVTQDEKTQLVINVESLKYAYNVIPDLNTAKNVLNVEYIGVKKWEVVEQRREVYNW